MSKQRNIRKRRAIDEDDEEPGEDAVQQGLSTKEIKFLQKQRHRKTGLDAGSLATGRTESLLLDEAPSMPDVTNEATTVLHAGFSKGKVQQTGDEDNPEMKRYVEEQVALRLGKNKLDNGNASSDQVLEQHEHKVPKTVEELAIEAVVPRQKDLYSEPGATFVAGVTEVPLDVRHVLQNIEATERAKTRLLLAGQEGDSYDSHAQYDGQKGLQRSQFPVRFGKMSEKEARVLETAAAKRAAQRAKTEQEKRKKAEEFKGFF